MKGSFLISGNTRINGLLKIYVAATIVLSLLLLVSGCSNEVKQGNAKLERPIIKGLKVETINKMLVPDYYEATGTVRSKTTSIISSKIMGAVTAVNVKEGDRVRQGQLLITIDNRDLASNLSRAEGGLKEAEARKDLADVTYERYKNLYDENALSRQEFDSVATQRKIADEGLRMAKAEVSGAKTMYSFSRITSPLNGIVTERKIDPGSMAVPGVPLITIEDTGHYRLEASVDESYIRYLKSGMDIPVRIDSIGKNLKGRLVEVSSVDPMSRSALIKIDLPSEGLQSGLYGSALIPVGQKTALIVPKDAVVERGELTGIYVVENSGIIHYRLIRTGRMRQDGIEVISGLSSGERVVVSGVDRAVDGGRIEASR